MFKGLFIVTLLLSQMLAYGQMHLDSTFGINGVVKISLEDYTEPVKVMKLDGDTLLLLANLTPIDSVLTSDFGLIKLTPEGKVDSSYGTNGYVRYHFYKKEVSYGRALLRLSNGKMMVLGSGYSHAMPAYLPACIMKLNVDGSVDSSFGHSGTLDLQFANIQEFPTVLKMLTSGKIIMGGYTIDSSDTHSEVPVLAQMDETGKLDTTFGAGGRVYVRFGGGYIHSRHLIGGLLYDILEMPDSSLLVSGGYSDIYNLVGYVMNVSNKGIIDTSFMGRGYFSADFSPLYNSQIVRLQRASNGKIWLAASSNAPQGRDFNIGEIDLANATYNTSAVDYQGNEDIVTDMVLDDNGNPMMVGKSFTQAHNQSAYASDYFTIDQQPAANFPFLDQKFTFSDDTTLQCGAVSAVMQSNNRLISYGFQYKHDNTSQLMLIATKVSSNLVIREAQVGDVLKVYPNPTSDILQVQLPSNVPNAQLVIYNIMGERIMERTITTSESINVNGWANGLYFVQVSGVDFSSKATFVKQ